MSKRKQTENLHLYAYENLRGLPTFLKDWSDNMAILDGAHSTVLSLIDGLNGRLTTAEGLIEDLSPESIEDYKIRLDALEKKVVINTNNIKDVNTKIATVNAQINSINVEQGVQNNRLTTLEGVVNNHSTLVSELRTDLTSVDGRVTTLEQCCENVQHEIADIQNDVNGFNDDVTALATQVETLSTAVNELTELVNSLQLDVVSQRLDAFEADLAGLTTRMTNAEIDITDNSDAIDALGVRITASESDIANVQNEIGNTDYSEVGDTVSSSLVELADRIRALTPQAYDILVARLSSAESDIDTLQDDVNTLQGDVSTVSSNVTSLQNVVSGIQSDVGDLQTDVGTAQNNIASLDGDVNALQDGLTVTDPTEGNGLITFGVDTDGNYGYKKVGADTVTPFKKGGVYIKQLDVYQQAQLPSVLNDNEYIIFSLFFSRPYFTVIFTKDNAYLCSYYNVTSEGEDNVVFEDDNIQIIRRHNQSNCELKVKKNASVLGNQVFYSGTSPQSTNSVPTVVPINNYIKGISSGAITYALTQSTLNMNIALYLKF